MVECLANELGANIQHSNGACFRNIKNLIPYIMRINYGDILFIDEIHRLSRICEEFLYIPMEDYFCVIGQDNDVLKLQIPKFTLIGATTNFGDISKPLKSRFKLQLSFMQYKEDDLAKLARLNANRLKVDIDQDASESLGRRSRGTPRVLNRLLEWCRDYCLSTHQTKITTKLVCDSLNILGIDENGFTKDDQNVIMILKREKRPVPLRSLSAMTKIDENTLLNEVEPFLIGRGIITKTNKGRILC